MKCTMTWVLFWSCFLLHKGSYAQRIVRQATNALLPWSSPEYTTFFQYPLPLPTVKTPKLTYLPNDTSKPAIDYYEVELNTLQHQFYPQFGPSTMIGFDGQYIGPTFRMQRGREAVVRWINRGPSNMTVHVHGQYNRSPFDGWAADLAQPNQYKDDYYPCSQSARTLWYHAHTEFATAQQVYEGQVGFYLITDTQEQGLGLPAGPYDVPLMLGSSFFTQEGLLNFASNSTAGLFGDVNLVNGQPWPYLEVEPRKYRFRVLDASVSRTYRIYIATEQTVSNLTFNVIASDAGLFDHPVPTDNLAMSVAERYEIIVDFANYAGQNLTLRNTLGMGEDDDYPATDILMRFVVGTTVTDDSNNNLPANLATNPAPPNTETLNKDFTFSRDGGNWTINGVGWADVANRILEKPARGAVEKWRLTNGGGNGTHPVHIHLVDFQVLSRTGGRNEVYPYESAGMKDVIWLDSGETVDVVARYAPWDGVYMFHCHNMIHEDHDMMVAFNVTQLANWGYMNDTIFVDPMEPAFRPKDITDADFTTDAIMQRLAFFYGTNAYNEENINGVYSALDAYSASSSPFAAPTGASTTVNGSSTPRSIVATSTGTLVSTATSTSLHSGYRPRRPTGHGPLY